MRLEPDQRLVLSALRDHINETATPATREEIQRRSGLDLTRLAAAMGQLMKLGFVNRPASARPVEVHTFILYRQEEVTRLLAEADQAELDFRIQPRSRRLTPLAQ